MVSFRSMILIVAAAFASIASAVLAAPPMPSLDGLVGGSLYLGFLWLLEQHLGRI